MVFRGVFESSRVISGDLGGSGGISKSFKDILDLNEPKPISQELKVGRPKAGWSSRQGDERLYYLADERGSGRSCFYSVAG